MIMVYCTECGAKNEDTAETCVKCGTPLATKGAPPPWRKEWEREECFGLPRSLASIVFGLMIIFIGFVFFLQETGVIVWDITWPLIIILFGLLVLAGGLYTTRRR